MLASLTKKIPEEFMSTKHIMDRKVSSQVAHRNALKSLYLNVSVLAAKADGEVLEEELRVIRQGMGNIGLIFSQEELEDAFTQDPISPSSLDFSILSSDWERESVISLMLLIAHCDDDYSPEEDKVISDVAAALQISSNRANEIKAIIEEEKKNALS